MITACFDIPVKQASRDNVEGDTNYFVQVYATCL
jgi:hypothetical protein